MPRCRTRSGVRGCGTSIERNPGGNVMRKIALSLAAAAVAGLGSIPALAQDWPSRPVTMLIAFAPGGPLDTLGRNLQPYLSEALGQNVIIENQPGGGGTVGSLRVSNAAADSHMFTLGSIGTHAIGQSMHKTPPYNAVTDFSPVMLVADAPQVLLARKDLPAENLKEFAAYAKANQDKMQHGSGGAGTSSHIGCVLMNQVLGVKITHIPYRGGGPAMQDLLAGRIDFICNYISTALSSHRAKTAKVLATLNAKRVPTLPDVPTAQEQGFKNLEISAWNAIFMPKSATPQQVAKLNSALNKALDNPALQKRLEDIGLEVPVPARRTPEYLREFVAAEIKRWREPVLASGVQHN
ncbi:MAG: tripartite tricarboxylate transporter substrate binding protein [Alphaproteobacteria bacterium]|nr:tripartite tricarboxylate transporter substrate binding protein [Alphaproteobacteria bacterium]